MKNVLLALFALVFTISAIGQEKYETFIPAGWHEISREDGDINLDSKMNYDISHDRAVIIEKIDPGAQGIRQTSLLVLLGTTTREYFTLYCNSDLAAPDQGPTGFKYLGNSSLSIDREKGVLAVFFKYIAADSSEVMHFNTYKFIDNKLRNVGNAQISITKAKDKRYVIGHDLQTGTLSVEVWDLPNRKSLSKTESIVKVESFSDFCTYDGSERIHELYALSIKK